MADVFISYSRADRPRIEKLAEALSAAGIGVWWDDQIEGGAEFSQETEARLNEARAVIVAWSRDSVLSTWVADEATVGRDKKILVPILLDETPPKIGFRQFQTINFAHWAGDISAPEYISLSKSIANKIGSAQKLQLAGETGADSKKGARPTLAAGDFAEASGATPPASATKRTLWAAAATAALILALGLWVLMRPQPTAPQAPLTIAVMPFEVSGGGADAQSSGQILSRDVRNRLSRIRGLRVIADTSSFAVASEGLDAQATAKRLGADLLLDGAVRKAATSLNINIELIDGKNGGIAWNAEQTVGADDPAAAEAAVAEPLIEHLVRELGPSRVQALMPPRPVSNEVRRLLVQARTLIESQKDSRFNFNPQQTLAAGAAAEEALLAALKLDPKNASAMTMLAWMETRGDAPSMAQLPLTPFQRRERGAALLRRAIAADANEPAALTAMAEQYRRFDWRWSESEQLVRRAIAIDPNFAPAHAGLNYLLMMEGRCVEALEHAKIAAALDPEFSWGRLPVLRALKCLGRDTETDAQYNELLKGNRGSLFLISEMYLTALGRRDAGKLRALVVLLRDQLWGGAPPPPVAARISRIDAGIAALEGRPQALMALVEADMAAYAALDLRTPPQVHGRLTMDFLWTLAIEAAHAGATDRAVNIYQQAIDGRTLYISDTLRYGRDEFSPAMRTDPRYLAIWSNDPALVELAALRLKALKARQMNGVLPNGKVVASRLAPPSARSPQSTPPPR